jgi:hypothetical protein
MQKHSANDTVSAYPFVTYVEHPAKSGKHSAAFVALRKFGIKVLVKKHQKKRHQIHSGSCDLQLYSLPQTYPKIQPY